MTEAAGGSAAKLSLDDVLEILARRSLQLDHLEQTLAKNHQVVTSRLEELAKIKAAAGSKADSQQRTLSSSQ